jgi:hypothetical protein
LAALKTIAPSLAAGWPQYFELDEIIDGVEERRENISEVWAWLGNYDLGRKYASTLFSDLQITAVPILMEQTADELIALLSTTSPYGRLSNEQRMALDHEYSEIYSRLGRSIRSSIVNILVTARKSQR